MTTRRKVEAFRLGAYDYLAAHQAVVDVLKARGEPTKLTPTEMSSVTIVTEVCAARGMNLEAARPFLVECANDIIAARRETLFPPFDERDVMGDDCCAPDIARAQADGVAA